MLGLRKREEKKLREHGSEATAEVLEATRGRFSVTVGDPQLVENTQILWHLTLRVRPQHAEEFTADVKQRFSQMSSPVVGMTLPVLYDPDDHSKLAIDHDDAAAIDTGVAIAKSRVDEMLAGDPARAAQLGSVIDAAIGDRTRWPPSSGRTRRVQSPRHRSEHGPPWPQRVCRAPERRRRANGSL